MTYNINNCYFCEHEISSVNDTDDGGCRDCEGLPRLEQRHLSVSGGKEEQYITPNDFKPHLLHFHGKCHAKWEGSDCQKNYDLKRLEALKIADKKDKEEGKYDKNDWLYNFYSDEIKVIEKKWNIKEKQPQEREREREREREQNCQTEIWNTAIRANC